MLVRVRFAPSPTGMLHVGALRDALFKFLFAKHHDGVNIFRIEDTDRTRYSAESEQEFVETLKWVGIEFDEGPHIGGPNAPYRQSERKAAGVYQPHIERLLELGHAYKAFETPEELDEMREVQQINKQPTGYFGGSWRDASPEQVAEAAAAGKPFVIRLKIPRNTTIEVHDAIRGRLEWDSNLVDDAVLIKGDGMPTYHFASMVDDHLMGITHIMRGEEWISSAPKHAALFDAFGWERPVFVHMPLIVGADGKKLSKRHGATRVLDYAAQGFLPDALMNFIALIGWSPGDGREAMTEEELIGAFDIRGLQPSPGRFDIEKLRWLNGHAIRQMEPEALLDALLAYIDTPYTHTYWHEFEDDPQPNQKPIDGKDILRKLSLIKLRAATDRAYVLAAVKEEQERVQTLADFGEACEFFLVEEPPMDPKSVEKWLRQEHVPELFAWIQRWTSASQTVERADDGKMVVAFPDAYSENAFGEAYQKEAAWFFNFIDQQSTLTLRHLPPAFFDAMLRSFQEKKGFDKLGPVVHPTRVALTGKTTGPGLFELMAVLGPARIEKRLERALKL